MSEPESRLARARALLAQLVAYDTTSRLSNLALIEAVEADLRDRGAVLWRAPDDSGTKANLIARIGPDAPGGVVLSGHTDVVPVDGQDWTSDPFTLTARDGRLYGRGTADMKAFLALSMAQVEAGLGERLARPLWLAFSHDEEVGCLGAPALIARLLEVAQAPPALVIVGEPTELRVVTAHKGIRTYEVVVTGKEAHSSQPHLGVSAVGAAVELMGLLGAMAAEAEAAAPPDSPFIPPHPTLTIGRVEGGTAVNILAGRCAFLWDLRCPPGVDPDPYEARFFAAAEALNARLQARAPEAGVRVRRRSATPALASETVGPAEALARALTGDNGLHTAAFATEAGLFQGAGLSTVVCGPGSIDQAHQPDEWIAESQLAAGDAFLAGVVRRLMG